ncbi:hypothetical protein G7046_g2331 [Stylonectria norvegica]|nr:hypothetical protein G7046_g2331 [Stylonectria norvegica]
MMATKQPNLWAVEFITFAAATIFLVLRLMSRRLTKVDFWWDDYLAICCYIMAIFWVILVPLWISKGLGLHVEDVTSMTVENAKSTSKLFLYIGELIYASALFFGKTSILCFYWRMFRVTNIKLPIQLLLGASVIWMIVRTIMAIFHCVPIHAFWDTNVKNAVCNIDDAKFFFGTILVHVILDICILIVPIVQIRKLQLPRLQKLGIMAMFCFGIFICAAALVIIVESTRMDQASPDITWNLTVIIVWATVEVNLVTVSACLPAVRPAFLYLVRGVHPNSSLGSGSNSYGHSQPTKKSMRMSNMRKTDADEGSSTYQLADSVRGGGSISEFETHALDRQDGMHTTITGHETGGFGSDNTGLRTTGGGIVVKNETFIHVSTSR